MPKQPPLLLIIPIILGIAVASFVQAQDTSTVTATVQFQNITVSVTDGSIDYGILGASTASSTVGSDTQTATNDGNTAADFNIKGQDATSGTGTDWTLDTTTGPDQYTHEFSTNGGSSWTNLATSSYTSLATGIAADGTETFDLQITTPDSSSDTDQKNADVTVQAVAN